MTAFTSAAVAKLSTYNADADDDIMNDNKNHIKVGYYNTFSSKNNKLNIPVMKQTMNSAMISNILKLTTAAVGVIAVTTTIDIVTTHYSSSSSSSTSSIKKDIPLSLSSSLSTNSLRSRRGNSKCEVASGAFGGFSEGRGLDDDDKGGDRDQTNFETCFRKGNTDEYCWSKSFYEEHLFGCGEWFACAPQGIGDANGWAVVQNPLGSGQNQLGSNDDYRILTCGQPCTLFSKHCS
mmetsp:Transcript_61297/g.68628  ORF Transcript_61297/g.68628 Transcript_61297/m.68628 type:complete len:235 (-) Transcript_61297:130-834(-)|eukprot:CAMPEP_0170778494 /NCGR_PEP_ID=MMETSP0733-20121128/12426_1 /TAXON_ID=186038 /ORGANISM="Fragilariopsis kerguelensis, Strain L26-C5" /LENGTH=234 /DNA_ID=CAMNT_0011121931 /DNA_START=150 /DNA_END=854 /DNA_ORIENTATION=-